jgi:hypothetical protein
VIHPRKLYRRSHLTLQCGESRRNRRESAAHRFGNPYESGTATTGIRCSFLKKRTKKLLRLWFRVKRAIAAPGANGQKFFAYFFQKRRPFFTCPS